MSYPNVSNYIHTNKINIDELKLDIIESAKTAISDERFQVVENLTQNITRAMGDFWFSVDGTIPAGGLPHLGHLVSRALYQDFYIWLEGNKTILSDEEWLAYANSHGGCCPYYSSGDGSTTFRTPSYPDTFLRIISDINGGGVYQREGLPNIIGSAGPLDDMSAGTSGAMYYAYAQAYDATSSGSGGGWVLGFDASRSNAIYGSSSHVTPKNISMLIGVYAVGAIVPVGVTDAEKLMSGITRVEGLLDTKIDKIQPYVVEQAFNDTFWFRAWSNGWLEQGGVFQSVAGANQIFTFPRAYKSTNYYMFATNFQTTDAGICVFAFVPSTNTSCMYCTAYAGGFYSEQFRWYACGY